MSNYQSTLIEIIFNADKAAVPAQQVYQNNYLENALNALSIEFPTVKHLLGEDNFRGIMSEYVKTHPKSDFNWSSFGQHMHNFLLNNNVVEEMPFLIEIAKVDWHFRLIEKKADVSFEPSSFGLMQTHPPEQLQFSSASGFEIITAFFPVDLMVALPSLEGTEQYHSSLSNVKKAIQTAIKSPKPRSFLMWRREYQPCIQALDERQKKAFQRLAENESVQDVLEAAGNDANQISMWLQSAIEAQQICAVKVAD